MICESSENYFLWAFSPTLAFSLWAFRPSLDFQPKWVESLRRLKATSYAVDGLLYAKCQKAITPSGGHWPPSWAEADIDFTKRSWRRWDGWKPSNARHRYIDNLGIETKKRSPQLGASVTMAATGTAKAPHSAKGWSDKLLDRIEKVHREGIAIDSLSSASKEILSILSFVILRTLLCRGAHRITSIHQAREGGKEP